MTKKETAKILAVLKAAYPSSFTHTTDERLMLEIWHDSLDDADYEDVNQAVRKYIATNEDNFAPSIGKIRKLIVEAKQPETGRMTSQEAASVLSRAVGDSLYHSVEQFQKLPPLIQKVVRDPQTLFEWGQLPIETFQTVVLSNFQRSYQVALQQSVEDAKLPDDLKPLPTPAWMELPVYKVSKNLSLGE